MFVRVPYPSSLHSKLYLLAFSFLTALIENIHPSTVIGYCIGLYLIINILDLLQP